MSYFDVLNGEVNDALHWNCLKIKFLADLNMGQSPPSEAVGRLGDFEGLPFLQGNAEFGDCFPLPSHVCAEPPKVAKTGDLLISVRAPVGALNIADQDYGIGRGLCAIRWKNLYPRFGWWAMHFCRSQLEATATGSTYPAVSVEDVADVKLSFPGYDLQKKIADYLDNETDQIYEAIERNEKSVELLKERRSALIIAAVSGHISQEEMTT